MLEELRIYSRIVTPGSYLIVAGTQRHPAIPSRPITAPAPWKPLTSSSQEIRNFESDSSREKFMMTFNPRGYLKRLR